ncbi:hypothetical protein PVK06_021351 [Gossypium arboreum]|uniref:Uncharacterized protein n=1 Tax=Gossypium arboreum TaxID=29729 RepID=A0ABR0PPR7_GOSAR|nr:hypothetical protein PVK06_021351 [Gossypium arboreum]
MNDKRSRLQKDPRPSVHPQSAFILLQNDSIQSVSTPRSNSNILDDWKFTQPTMALDDKASPITHPLLSDATSRLLAPHSIYSSPSSKLIYFPILYGQLFQNRYHNHSTNRQTTTLPSFSHTLGKPKN